MKTLGTLKKGFGFALAMAGLVCGMVETPDMLEIWLRTAGVLAIGTGMWLAEAYEWQQFDRLTDQDAIVDEGDEGLE